MAQWNFQRVSRLMNLGEAIEVLYSLSTGVIGSGSSRHERPHKPVMLLAVLDAIATGKARPDFIEWSDWLRRRFRVYFDVVKSRNDECTPENPFLYLKSDGFWRPMVVTPEGEISLETTPMARDLDTGTVLARFADGWDIVANPLYRLELRDALISRFFPAARSELRVHFLEPVGSAREVAAIVAEDDDVQLPGRSAAFRRRVLEIYDYQCAACGLRIWMPDRELTFVDAAHLIPFAETRNDHPTNGIALCKNHHWALDQRLIAPDPESIWRISRHVEPRRSKGEEELARLDGQALLRPIDSAFAPQPE